MVFYAGVAQLLELFMPANMSSTYLFLFLFFSRNANLKCNEVGINEETERERERKAALCEACRHDASQQTQFLTSLLGSGSCLQVHKRDIDNAEHVTGGKTTLEDLGWVAPRLHRCQKSKIVAATLLKISLNF